MLKAAKSIFILVILIYGKLYAQEGLQSGRVIDKEKQIPIQGASIVIYKERAVIYRTTTDSVGVFKIPKKLTGQVSIKISSIGYDFIVIALKITISDLGVFELKPHIIILKDVTIRPNKRYRDTTNIDLSNKKFERSKMIDDLLSKEMGFSKDSNGQLYYKGKPVSDIVLNNGDFFGKNNLDIYRLMPALTISNIQITETNVDSLTNVTLLKPVIKVNLVLKDQYKKGIFGNANAGVGSSNRYLANTGLYTYKNNEQISLALNSNNLNTSDNTLINPKINFSPDGNNITTSSAKLTYRNIYANKLEVNFSVKAKSDKKTFNSLSLRQEEDIDQFSKTSNNSSIKSFGISDANFKMNYKIDSLNTITATQKFDHFKTTEIDSLNYIIETDGFNYNSQLKKSKATVTDMWNTDISYLKKFADKKTILNTDFQFNSNTYSIGENDNIYNLSNNGQSGYFLKGSRLAKEYLYILSSNVTEPLNESTFLGLSASFQIDKFNYRTKVISDTLLNNTDPSFDFVSNKVQIGAKFHKTWRKVSFDANTDGNLYTKQSYILKDAQHNFFNIGLDLRAEYEINSKKSLNLNYNQLPNYPGIQELTSLNNSFDLLSQISGNIDLKPEQKKTFKLSYTTRTDGAESISIGAELSH